MIRGTLYIGFCILLLVGCKKDELIGPKEIFVGSWKHINSNRMYRVYNDKGQIVSTIMSTILPSELGYDSKIVFDRKGKIVLYKDGEKVNGGKVLFRDFIAKNNPVEFKYSLFINSLDRGDVNDLGGIIKNDTLIAWQFPLTANSYGKYRISHSNYFVRE